MSLVTGPAASSPNLHQEHGNGAARPSLFATEAAIARGGAGYFEWLDHVWSAAGCSHPVRLHGELTTLDTRTGEVLDSVPTSDMPDGVIYKACGNRRASDCPSCSEIYRGDAFQIIRTGLVGGHGVPEHVAAHPAVFATFTAPSFGPVHARHVKRHSCRDKTRCTCRPEPCHARRPGSVETCPHGIILACFTRHGPRDEQLGQPLCLDCYDHDAHVVWNNHTGELWRRTKQAIQRHLNHLARQRRLPKVRVSHGKAAEYQNRGAVHFHALLRLDGVHPEHPEAIIPPPAGLTVADLYDAVHQAAATITVTTEPHPANPHGWHIGWGEQTDVRPITLTGDDPVTDGMVGNYLAKYSTKGTEITGHTSRRLDDSTIRLYANPIGNHAERLIQACWDLGQPHGWDSLRRWAHMLGFGGHFLTKGRHYSITFAQRRQARIIYRRTQTPGPDCAEIKRQDHVDTETTLVVGQLTYAGTGWHTTADALLANTAADQARKRRWTGREELAHEQAIQQHGLTAA